MMERTSEKNDRVRKEKDGTNSAQARRLLWPRGLFGLDGLYTLLKGGRGILRHTSPSYQLEFLRLNQWLLYLGTPIWFMFCFGRVSNYHTSYLGSYRIFRDNLLHVLLCVVYVQICGHSFTKHHTTRSYRSNYENF